MVNRQAQAYLKCRISDLKVEREQLNKELNIALKKGEKDKHEQIFRRIAIISVKLSSLATRLERLTEKHRDFAAEIFHLPIINNPKQYR